MATLGSVMKILVTWSKYLDYWLTVNSTVFQEELYSMPLTITSFPERNNPHCVKSSSLSRLTISLRHTTVGSTPLDEWSARRRGLYMTTHNTHKRQDSKLQSQQASGRRPTPRTRGHGYRQLITGIPYILQILHIEFSRHVKSDTKIPTVMSGLTRGGSTLCFGCPGWILSYFSIPHQL